MAAGRNGFPTPPDGGLDRDHTLCPVCGWTPCTSCCSLGLTGDDLLELRMLFPRAERDCDHGDYDAPPD